MDLKCWRKEWHGGSLAISYRIGGWSWWGKGQAILILGLVEEEKGENVEGLEREVAVVQMKMGRSNGLCNTKGLKPMQVSTKFHSPNQH